MKNYDGVLVTVLAVVAVILAWAVGIFIVTIPDQTAPAPAVDPSSRSTVIDTRTEVYAKFEAENDKWLDERNSSAQSCFTRGGVPVLTLGLRVFCVKNEALVDEPGGIGEPHRPAPKYPKQ